MNNRQCKCKRCGVDVTIVQGMAPEEGAMLLLNVKNGLSADYLCRSCTDLIVPHLAAIYEVLGDDMRDYHNNSYTTLLKTKGIMK